MNEYPFIGLREARELLSARMPLLTQSLADSWKTWWGDFREQHAVLDATTRAMIINRNFYFNAARHLANDRGVEFREDQLQKYIVIDGQLILRFKLLDRNLEASNYPTTRSLEWVKQIPLKEIPPCERLHFGYRLNLTETTVNDAFITCPNGIPHVINDWVWQVWGNPIDSSRFGMQLRLFGPPARDIVVYAYDDFSVDCA